MANKEMYITNFTSSGNEISIDSLLDENSEEHKLLMTIPIERCIAYAHHPFKVGDTSDLASDMKKYGQKCRITVRPLPGSNYGIIMGHRRVEAAKKAGLPEIEAYVIEVSGEVADRLMIESNFIQRHFLSRVEMARACKIIKKYYKGNSLYKYLAEKLGVSLATVKRILYLSQLDDELLDLVDQKKLRLGPAEKLHLLTHKQMRDIARLIRETGVKLSLEDAARLGTADEYASIVKLWNNF